MKQSLMLVGAMMISSFIFAQNDAAPDKHGRGDGQYGDNRRGDGRESMKSVLSLDEKQSSSITEINKKYFEKGKEAHQDLNKDLNKQREAEISKVLTPDQNKKWTDHKKERAEKFVKMRDERVKKNLNLSDDQFTKLKSTLSEEQFNKLAFGNRSRGGKHHSGGKHHGK